MPVRRRYHFHVPGVVYILITLLIALGAFNSQNNLLFWAFGFALAILIVSGLISGRMLMGIRATRDVLGGVARATAGEPLTLLYRVTNRSRLVPAFAIGITESPPSPPPPSSQLTQNRATPLSHAPEAFSFLIHAGPGETVEVRSTITPQRRGLLRLDEFRLDTTFPFGLVRKSLLFREPRSVIVRPRPLKAPDDLLSRRRTGDRGQYPRPARAGHGEEFFALREYVPGDSPRSIAWRASARAGGLLVRQHSEPAPRRVTVAVLTDATTPDDAAEATIGRAAGVILAAAELGYEVGLVVPAAGLSRPPAPGRGYAGRLLDDLALLDLHAPTLHQTVVRPPARGDILVAVHPGRPDPARAPAGAVNIAGPELAAPSPAPASPPAANATA